MSRPTWRIWVCRCPGVFWAEQPRHMTCTWCGRLIMQIDVGQVPPPLTEATPVNEDWDA